LIKLRKNNNIYKLERKVLKFENTCPNIVAPFETLILGDGRQILVHSPIISASFSLLPSPLCVGRDRAMKKLGGGN
jgi:hypothetical protein